MPKVIGNTGKGVQAVTLLLRLLECIADRREAIGITEMAQALQTTKSRAYRHVRTLVDHGYLVQESSEKYRVGPRLIRLGRRVSENMDLASAARPAMAELRDALGHSVVLSQIEADGVRVLAALSGTSAIEIGVKHGSILGFHYSAQGKVALAFGDDEMRARTLRSRLEIKTPKTVSSTRTLAVQIQRIRRQGWASAPNEAAIGINALAAPIFEASGSLVGVIAIVDSIQFIEEKPTTEQIRRILEAGRRVSQALGYTAERAIASKAAA